MKNILLITALFIGFNTAYAQSDATWEETIDWINLKLKDGGEFQKKTNKNIYTYKFSYSGEVELIISFDDGDYFYHYAGDLYDASGATTYYIRFYGDVVKEWISQAGKEDYGLGNADEIELETRDSQSLERVKTALTHLIKLAKEKKAKERKDSGEKF